MKHCRKLLAMLLLISMLVLLFAACGEKKGSIIAVYNNKPVYEAEVADIINYELGVQYTSTMTPAQLEAIMENAVVTYVQYKAIELDLEKKGITVDEKELKKAVEENKQYINDNTEGGYNAWKQSFQVSDSFLEEHLRRAQLRELCEAELEKEINVTDDMAYDYYLTNSLSYTAPAGYNWTSVLHEALNIEDAAECAAIEAEMKDYIAKITAGTMTMDDAKNAILAENTADKGYKYGSLFQGADFTATTSLIEIADLDAKIAEIKASYNNPVYKAEMTDEEKKAYENCLAEVFKAEVFYALQNLEVGEVYEKPIKSSIGYYIIRLDSISTVSGFKPFEDVKANIVETLTANALLDAYDAYLGEITIEYGLAYSFN